MWGRGSKKAQRQHSDTPIEFNGYGVPLHLAFEYRSLPDAGANQYAFETLLLPRYTPIGTGVPNQNTFGAYAGQTQWAIQGVYLTRIGNPGIISGDFVSPGPLIDTSSSALGGYNNAPDVPNYLIPAGGA